ncbi:type VI secretion system contractile sheath large subunit [Serratia ureilytica]
MKAWVGTKARSFKKVYEEEYGQFGGEPFGCLVGDYYFDHSPQDVELLGEMAKIGAASHRPFIAGTAPSVMQMESGRSLQPARSDQDFPEHRVRRLAQPARVGRRALPGLVMPRSARLPYGIRTNPVDEFDFEEDTDGATHGNYTGPTPPTPWPPTSTVRSKSSAGAPPFAGWNPAARWKTCRATPSRATTAAWT